MAPARLPLVVVVIAVAGLLLAAPPAGAALPRVAHAPKAGGTLAVLAVGDWGRRGQFNQTLVAQQVKVKPGVNLSSISRTCRMRAYVASLCLYVSRSFCFRK